MMDGQGRVMIKVIAIIGAGQLGFRHLQGLIKSTHKLLVHVVDPFELSRNAVQHFVTSQESLILPDIRIHTSINDLPPIIDIAIIATTAEHRLEVIEDLLHTSQVRHLILEKFLFNDSLHFVSASHLIAKKDVTTWVNTPRRHFSVYRSLLETNLDNKLLQFTVDGGDWGLCCNSVHFVDLAQFLSGNSIVHSIESRLDQQVIPSKRKGFIELTGEITGQVGSTYFSIRSVRNSTKPLILILHYEQQTIVINEGSSTLLKFATEQFDSLKFVLPYQSEMTGTIVDQLLNTGQCDLTPYADSVAAHLPLLNAFAKCAGKSNATHSYCQIT